MSAAQLALRMLCSRARVNMKLLRDGLLSKNGDEQNRLVETADEFSKAPIFIDDSSALSIMELRAKARRVHARHKLGFIVVDYLQLLSPTDARMPREQQVAEASRGLKSLAKELDVPVLVLSQLNRSSEKENRTPKLADLRESGSIEQDADVVLMLARPKDADEKFQVAADSAELIVAKQRNGPVGELKLTFLRDITRFENFHSVTLCGGSPAHFLPFAWASPRRVVARKAPPPAGAAGPAAAAGARRRSSRSAPSRSSLSARPTSTSRSCAPTCRCARAATSTRR